MGKRFTSVNLLWQKRLRGLSPFSAQSVSPSGETLVIQPDPLENRTYQVLNIDPHGQTRELFALFVETVYKFVGAPDGQVLLAMTDDDVYIARETRKVRFLPDRRVNYADVSLAVENGTLVSGFSDVLFSIHAIALGDVTGRLLWSRDVDAPVNRVAISPDGITLAAGLEDGRVLMLDHRRNLLWESGPGHPITAIALPSGRPWPLVGNRGGGLVAFNQDGGIRWQGSIGLPIVALATEALSQWTAVAASDGEVHLVSCHGADGTPVWEYAPESAPTGIALSPDGRYLALSTASGIASLFELDLRFAPGFGVKDRRGRDLLDARAAFDRDDLETSAQILTGLLSRAPHDLEVARELHGVQAYQQEKRLAAARAHLRNRAFPDALDILERAYHDHPWDPELFALRGEARAGAIELAIRRASELMQEQRWVAAAAVWNEVLSLDPTRMDAREALAEVRRMQAGELLKTGDERLEAGDTEAACQAWRQAYELDPSDEVEERISRLEVRRCIALGQALYEEQRIPEALFQFKKALALDPRNETAQKYLGYTEGITADSQIADRFARLE